MFKVNEDYLKLPGSYLFSTIGKKVRAYQEENRTRALSVLESVMLHSHWHRRSLTACTVQ